jgi:hypothetical protein
VLAGKFEPLTGKVFRRARDTLVDNPIMRAGAAAGQPAAGHLLSLHNSRFRV